MTRCSGNVSPLSGKNPHINYNRRFTRTLCQFLLALLSSVTFLLTGAQAQTLPPTTSDDQMGEQAYQSYHGGDIDSVSLTSGTLTLNSGFLSYPQRGKLHLSFNLMYNNQPQHQGQLCTPPPYSKCIWMWGYPAGGPLPVERGNVYVSWGEQLGLVGQFIPEVITDGKLTTDVIFFSNWSLQMADGSKHPLGNMGTVTWTTNAVWCGAEGYQSPTYQCVTANGPFETLDTTGWKVIGALNPCLVTNGCYGSPVGAVDSEGVIHGNGTQQDPNGNEIASNSTTITDSLGRQIPLPPTSQSSGNANTSNCPVISGQPAAATAVLWSPPGYNSGTPQYFYCYAEYYQNYPPTLNTAGPSGNVLRLQSIVLPNGQSWQFQYNDPDPNLTNGGNPVNYTTLSQIALPTGGTISYTYNYAGSSVYNAINANSLCQDYGRWVNTRTVNANDGTGPHTWTYTYNAGNTVVTDPLGNDVVHTFGAGGNCQRYETQTQYYQGSHTSGTLLKTVNTTYSYSTSSRNTWPGGPINVVPTSIQTAWPNGQTSLTTKSYDSGYSYLDYQGSGTDRNGNPNVGIYGKEIKEQAYDYPSGTSLLRTTNTSYAWQSPNPNYSSYLTNNLLDLEYSVQVQDGSGTQRAYTYYGYDETGLQTSNISEQKVAGESFPGNETSVHRWLNGSTVAQAPCNVSVSNGYLVSNKVYYDTGEVQKNTDPCGYPTTYQYSSTYYGAFVTTATNALNQNTIYGYDFNTGAVTSIEDPNLQTTTKNYDILTRPTSISFPDGGSTTACYTDTGGATCTQSGAPYQVVVTKAITSSLNETSTLVFDGLGRLSQTELNSDSPSTTYTLTTYDALGRKSQVYNPSRCSPITTNCGETTWGYTTTNYDPLSRVTSVVEQDTSTVSSNYASVPCTTVTDEAGKARKSCVDGLGRMTGVWEDPSGLNYETDYGYDALGNLTSVNQKGSNVAFARTRSFTYDSLSELTSATNPESGQISYGYDADGNAITKTAPLPNQTGTSTVTTTSTYDTLNRLTQKSYKDGTTTDPYTPTVQFGYDAVALTGCTKAPAGLTDSYPVGRRTAMCDGSGAASYKHDQMGRILQERRTIGAVSGDYEQDAYNLAGLPTSTTILGYSVNYTYSGAGRALTATNYYTGGSSNFVSAATYAPPGGLATMTMGSATGFAGITASNAYNNRLQPVQLYANSPSGTVLSLCYDFHLGVAFSSTYCSLSASAFGNNGNLLQVINNRDTNRTQIFTYDNLNRITSGQSSGSGSISWGENLNIDAWGNLYGRTPISGKTNSEGLTCLANTNNQLTTCSFGYDAAGNMTSNPPATYTYDAENRIIWTNAGSGYRYLYDGDGERVEKCVAGTPTTLCPTSGTNGTLYWRGTGTDTLAESDLSGNATEDYAYFNGERIARRDASTNAVHYYFSDHLGSTSLVTDAFGTLSTCGTYPVPTGEDESDYYPYGGEMVLCNRVPQNYKFTGKERDSESGLDYFGARHYTSGLGRFMVPDWAAKPTTVPYASFGNPQSLNLYAYVLNSPLVHRDVDGHIIDEAKVEKNKKYQQWKKNYLSHEGAQKQWDALNNNKNLTVHLSWDSKSSSSVTSGYQWDKAGSLTNVNVSLAQKTGDTSNPMNASSGYIHGSTLNNDSGMRQAYVIAHEFAHVEYADTQMGGASLRTDQQIGQHLEELQKQFGSQYSNQPGVGDAQRQLNENGYQREKGADQRAWDVLGDPK